MIDRRLARDDDYGSPPHGAGVSARHNSRFADAIYTISLVAVVGLAARRFKSCRRAVRAVGTVWSWVPGVVVQRIRLCARAAITV
jgi:hypothetical protein